MNVINECTPDNTVGTVCIFTKQVASMKEL